MRSASTIALSAAVAVGAISGTVYASGHLDRTKGKTASSYTISKIPPAGATTAAETMHYIAFDPSTGFLWAPAGNTGLAAVIDTSSGSVRSMPDGLAAVTSRTEVWVTTPRDKSIGVVFSSIDTGDGVDDIDYAPATHLLYVGAAKPGKLTVARVDDHGKLSVAVVIPTRTGASNPAVTDKGVVYLAHSRLGNPKQLVMATPR